MKVSISQAAYLPWLGYFDRIIKSDVHVVLDNVSMDGSSKTNFSNRNKIRTKDGWMWLSVPILRQKNFQDLPLNKVKICNDQPWAAKHLKAIQYNYGKTQYFCEHKNFILDLYTNKFEYLQQLNSFSAEYLMRYLGIHTEVIKSSDLKPTYSKSDLILELCEGLGAKTYISGPFGKDYLEMEEFSSKGIHVEFHEYTHPEYPQYYGGFEPYMSVLDLILNHGQNSRRILLNS